MASNKPLDEGPAFRTRYALSRKPIRPGSDSSVERFSMVTLQESLAELERSSRRLELSGYARKLARSLEERSCVGETPLVDGLGVGLEVATRRETHQSQPTGGARSQMGGPSLKPLELNIPVNTTGHAGGDGVRPGTGAEAPKPVYAPDTPAPKPQPVGAAAGSDAGVGDEGAKREDMEAEAQTAKICAKTTVPDTPSSGILRWAQTLPEVPEHLLEAVRGLTRSAEGGASSKQCLGDMEALRQTCLELIAEGSATVEQAEAWTRLWRYTTEELLQALSSGISLPSGPGNSAIKTPYPTSRDKTTLEGLTADRHGKGDGMGKPDRTSTVRRDVVPGENTGYMWDDSPFQGDMACRPRTQELPGGGLISPPLVTGRDQVNKVKKVLVEGEASAPKYPDTNRLECMEECRTLGVRLDALTERVEDVESSTKRAHVEIAQLDTRFGEAQTATAARLTAVEELVGNTKDLLSQGQTSILDCLASLGRRLQRIEREPVAEQAQPSAEALPSAEPKVPVQPESMQHESEVGAVGPVPPRYSSVFPAEPEKGLYSAAGKKVGIEEPARRQPVLVTEDDRESHISSVSEQVASVSLGGQQSRGTSVAAASVPARRGGVPLVGNKLVHEFVGRFSDDSGDKLSLRQFISKMNQLVDDMEWDQETAGRAAKSCLQGRAFDVVDELRGQRGAYTWDNIQRVFRKEFYNQAACTSSEVRLENIQRDQGENVRKFGARVERLIDKAYCDAPKTSRETEGCKAFLRGLNHREMSIHLREKYESLTGITLREMISAAEAYLSLREGASASTVQPTIAAVAGNGGQKNQSKPSNSGPAKKQQGKGKKKGPKPVAKTGNKQPNARLDPVAVDLLNSLVAGRNSNQQEGDAGACGGNCWRCGLPGHRKANCPQNFCRLVKGKENSCHANPKAKCQCQCEEHEHFGFGHGGDREGSE